MKPMPAVPARLRDGVQWTLDVAPGTRGRIPTWLFWGIGVVWAAVVAIYRFGPDVIHDQPMQKFIRASVAKVLADASIPFHAIDLSPVAILASAPLNLLPAHIATIIACLITAMSSVVAIRMLGVRSWVGGLVAVAFLCDSAAAQLLTRGDWLLVLFTLALGDVLLTRRGSRFAGYTGGAVVAMTPIFALFLLPGIVKRGWSHLIRAAVGFAAVSLPAAVLAPHQMWSYWRYHQLKRLMFKEESGDQQPLVAAVAHHIHADGWLVSVGLLAVVWILAAAVIVLALRRGRWAPAMAAASAAAFVWAAWPVGSFLLMPLFAVLLSRAPGRASRIPAALLLLMGFLMIWERFPAKEYPPPVVPVILLTLVVAWLAPLALEQVEVPALRRVGEVLTWPIWILPLAVALYSAGTFLGDKSQLWPWSPLMPDFGVYVAAAESLAQGNTPYTMSEDGWPFLYPPIGAILALPTAWWLTTSQAVWNLFKVSAWLLVLHRIGLRDWRAPVVLSLAIVVMGALGADFAMGNIQGLMAALIFVDLAPGRTLFRDLADRFGWTWAKDRTHLLPQGLLVGVLTAIKIIPALFLVLMAVRRRWRPVVTGVISAAVVTLIGAVLEPAATLQFAKMLIGGQLNQALDGVGIHYVSLVIALQRFIGPGHDTALALASSLIGTIGFFAAWRWHRAGRPWLGLSLCGAATIFFSPLAWNYYYVFLLPVLLIVFRQLRLDTPMPRAIQFGLLVAVLWVCCEFHLMLPNGEVPGGVVEYEDSYGWVQNLVAGGEAFTTAAALVLAAVIGRRRRAQDQR